MISSGETMGDLAGRVLGCVFAILLGEHLRILRIFDVKKEAAYGELAGRDAERAEGDHRGRDRRGSPLLQIHLGGRAGGDWRRNALRDHVEDARVGEVVEEGGVERGVQVCRSSGPGELEAGGCETGANRGRLVGLAKDVLRAEAGAESEEKQEREHR